MCHCSFNGAGLSPRGRGNLHLCNGCAAGHGSIPAWTGEPVSGSRWSLRVAVYPRVDGGTMRIIAHSRTFEGLSPRGRGNLHYRHFYFSRARSIPAWTGEPMATDTKPIICTVYPRVDGGTYTLAAGSRVNNGLSPRGRGNRQAGRPRQSRRGSIPAWTGEPHAKSNPDEPSRVYPRVDGGTHNFTSFIRTGQGLSPRGRGNPLLDLDRQSLIGSIPAWTGEPSDGDFMAWEQEVYPRVDGGTINTAATLGTIAGLSPRGRGNRSGIAFSMASSRSIPAWTGEP